MSVIILLIIFSVIVAAIFLGAFIWAVRTGQYDDTESPPIRMLFDERNSKQNYNNKNSRGKKDENSRKK